MKFGTDWTKVDAHAIQSEEYDDLPGKFGDSI